LDASRESAKILVGVATLQLLGDNSEVHRAEFLEPLIGFLQNRFFVVPPGSGWKLVGKLLKDA
jgi:hypothetical protein